MVAGKCACRSVQAAADNMSMDPTDPDSPQQAGPDDLDRKIVDLPSLLATVQNARQAGKTVVHCHGCFDIVHPGHIRYLQFARQQGDLLVVSLTGDSQVDKGPARPYVPQELRAENLAALQLVDYVLINPHPTAVELLAALRPEFYVKGHEYASSTNPDFARERQTVEGYGGRVIFSSGEVIFSSTSIIDRLGQSRQMENQRLAAYCSRHQLTNPTLARILGAIKDIRVLVIGDAILDRYVFCDAQNLASESPMMSLTQLDERSFLGGAAVVAQHVAAMGASACLVTSVGSDEPSEQLASSLHAAGVEHHMLNARPELVQKTRFVVDETKLLKLDHGHPHPLDSRNERAAADIIAQQVRTAHAVIWCDFGYGTITDGLWLRVSAEVRRHAAVVAADVSGHRSQLLRFAHVDLLCPTERELRTAMHDFDNGLSAVAWKCLHRTQAQHLLVTLDKRGLVAFDRQSHDPTSAQWRERLRSEHLPALGDRTVDKLGCGDALLAATTLSLAAGATLNQAAYLGSAAAAIELGRIGNVPVDAATLVEWLGSRDELSAAAKPVRRHRVPPSPVIAATAG